MAPKIHPLVKIGTTTDETVARILAVWDRATPADIEAGARWYDDGAALVDLFAERAGSREHAAAVLAQMSPRTRWARNVAGFTDLLNGEIPLYCLSANVARAQKALSSSDPLGTINGPKTRSFAMNLLSDRSAVTVDVHAVRIALGQQYGNPETLLARTGVYDAIANAYRIAAETVGVDPSTIQATTWITQRNGRAH